MKLNWWEYFLPNPCTPSWQANSRLASRKILRHLFKNPPLVIILSQINRIHIRPLCFSKIHCNITLPFTPGSSKWQFFITLSDKIVLCITHMSCVLHSQSVSFSLSWSWHYCLVNTINCGTPLCVLLSSLLSVSLICGYSSKHTHQNITSISCLICVCILTNSQCRIWGSDSGDYEDFRLLGYTAA
jgi:hypothetical protein